ncbi:MAG: hypothetical protein MR290_05825 [Ruminococcus sp.]|nr:hypothetical protein [Ruminococcus sp.]
MIKNGSAVRNISAKICNNKKGKAKDYIKKAVDDYCVSNPGKPFSVRILFGGINKDWRGTALQPVFYYYDNLKLDYDIAANRAAKDVGWLLKAVLYDDKVHTYEEFNGRTKSYIRIK